MEYMLKLCDVAIGCLKNRLNTGEWNIDLMAQTMMMTEDHRAYDMRYNDTYSLVSATNSLIYEVTFTGDCEETEVVNLLTQWAELRGRLAVDYKNADKCEHCESVLPVDHVGDCPSCGTTQTPET